MSFVSTRRPAGEERSFAAAVEASLAPDGGLFLPRELPRFDDVPELLALGFVPRSIEILARLLAGDVERAELEAVVSAAFDFPLPLVEVPGEETTSWVLELTHGPTLAFKDFGARFLAGWLARRRNPDRPLTVLTATSGDTGAAVAHAFWRRAGTRVVVLYPRGQVSDLQERQFATLGENVACYAVDGTFDDCQALAKVCFADRELAAELGLTSANSINVARLLAQIPYYFEAVARLPPAAREAPIVVSVPSGNFGNLCAGLLAQRLGLPVAAFCAATNANATVPEFLAGGAYRPRPSVATASNAMDVGAPSNWERIVALFGHDDAALRQALRGRSVSEAETVAALADLARPAARNGRGYLADPHTAVAYAALQALRRPGETGVFLATAHPAKFPDLVAAATGRSVPLPPALARLLDLPLLSRPLANDLGALKRELRRGGTNAV